MDVILTSNVRFFQEAREPSMSGQRSTIILQQFLASPKNHDVFGAFAAKYGPRIKECCLRHGMQEADGDDLTAAMLLRFFERDVFATFVFQSKEKFRHWLNKVVLNELRGFNRSRRRRPDLATVGREATRQALETVAEELVRGTEAACLEDLDRVQRARDVISKQVEDKTWKAFCLSVDDERSVRDVMRELGLSRTSVWQAVSRVKRKLRTELSRL
jgi:RNA polymerase sigma factor (sigma-70 family)